MDKVKPLADELGLAWRAFYLNETDKLDSALNEVAVVLHIAGPFSATSKPMADACIRTKTHYLDITGEIAVFEALAARDEEAKKAGVMLLPGVGFDVVPSDCLAAHVKRRLPDAEDVKIYIRRARSDVAGHREDRCRRDRERHARAPQRRDRPA